MDGKIISKRRIMCSSFMVFLLTFSLIVVLGPTAAFANDYVVGQSSLAVEIGDYEGLTAFIAGINDGTISADTDAVLTADIEVPKGAHEWVPLAADKSHAYQGTFNGAGHKVAGIRVDHSKYPDPWDGSTSVSNYTSFISFLGDKGEVRDLTVEADFNDVNYVAGIVSQNSGFIHGCTFSGSVHSETYPNGKIDKKTGEPKFDDYAGACGGIAACNTGKIKKCKTTAETTIYRGGTSAGGIAGENTGSGVVSGCINEASVSMGITAYSTSATFIGDCGGITGFQDPGNSNSKGQAATVNCINRGAISAEQSVGGICGTSIGCNIKNCENEGTIEGNKGNWIGGICGRFEADEKKKSQLTGCENTGSINKNISAKNRGSWIGGIAGMAEDYFGFGDSASYPIVVTNCRNDGEVYGTEYVGGVIGGLGNNNYTDEHITYVYQLVNFGAVTGQTYVGGVAGNCPGVMSDTINYGKISAVRGEAAEYDGVLIGGITGNCFMNGDVSSSYNMGEIDISRVRGLKIYAGGVAGAAPYDLAGCYYCMDTSGDVRASVGMVGYPDKHALTLKEMTGKAAAKNMKDLMDPNAGYHKNTSWHTMKAKSIGGKTYLMAPQFDEIPFSAEDVIKAGVNTEDTSAESLDNAVVKTAKAKYAYTGKKLAPALTVKLGQKTLKEGTDYVIYAYGHNKNVGTAEAMVLGKGGYYGKAETTFDIIPAQAEVESLKVGKKKLKVTMSKEASAYGGKGFGIQYRAKGSSKWETKTSSSESVTITGLEKGKRYQVRVCAYAKVSGKIVKGSWSSIKTSAKIQ